MSYGCSNKLYDKSVDVLEQYYRDNDVTIDPKGSEIIEFLNGKSVFITGATGFIGKLLIEKLLRACGEIKNIYILVRPKKGVHSRTRVEEIFKDKVFNVMKKIRPNYSEKIVGIEGDVSLQNLGINFEDTVKIIENVDIIFHVAATTKFNEKIKLATAINVKGTKEILKIAKECKHLKALVHVSTAFSNCTRERVNEEFYEPPLEPEKLIKIVDGLSNEELEKILPELLGKWPNTYSMTKAVAEDMVRNNSEGIPTCIHRPAVVLATSREPYVGWMENVFGPTYIIAGAMSGQVRVSLVDENKNADLVPGDYVINSMIAASYITAKDRSRDIRIYNYVSSPENPIRWGEFVATVLGYANQVVPSTISWHISLLMANNAVSFKLYSLLLHFLPAIVVDGFLMFSNKKIRLTKLYEKVEFFSNVNAYFSTKEWLFQNNNTQKLWENLNDADKKAFPFSIKDLNWSEYLVTYPAGIREYIFKDSWDNLPEAKKRRYRFDLIHKGTQVLLALCFIRIIYVLFKMLFM